MWPNGQIYDGEFKSDDCNGNGTLYYPDGKRFEGPWKDGKKHGKGLYVWPNGARYHVLYNDGKKKETGRLEDSKVKLDELKDNYANLIKRDTRAKEHLEFTVKDSNNFHRANV
jgi:hypothetical protein